MGLLEHAWAGLSRPQPASVERQAYLQPGIGVKLHRPVAGTQASAVQALLSLQAMVLLAVQAAFLQTSPLVQALPSLHGRPSASVALTHTPCLQLSAEQGLPSLHWAPKLHFKPQPAMAKKE